MNNIDLLKAIGDIDDKYLIEEESTKKTNRIVANKMVNIMKNKTIMYFVTSSVTVFVLILGVIIGINTNKYDEIASKNELNDENIENNKIAKEDIININSYQLPNNASIDYEMDINGKWVDSNLLQDFKNLNNIKFPEELDNIRQGTIYIKSEENDVEYSKVLAYSLIAGATNGNNANIQIDISKENFVLNCYWNYDDIKNSPSSFINNTEVKLFMSENSEDKTKVSGVAFFEYKDYKYRIEVYKITQDEFLDIIKTIVNTDN